VRTDWGQVYISRGIGQASPPVRVLSRPEIALIRLRTAG
jgi:predicted MPP superfamily phosphohydrolase